VTKKRNAKKGNEDKGRNKGLKSKNSTINAESLLGEISERAYEIFIQRGFAHGNDLEDWLQAENEVKERHEIV